jgi:hypothetical protein
MTRSQLTNPTRLARLATISAVGLLGGLLVAEPALAQQTATPEAGQAIQTVTERLLNLVLLGMTGLATVALAAYVGMIAVKGLSTQYMVRAGIAFTATVVLLLFRTIVLGGLDFVTQGVGTIYLPMVAATLAG